MTHAPVRFALVGCGQIAEAHRRAIDTVDDAELTWCQDVDADRAAALAGRHDRARASTDYAEVLSADDVDVVFLCLPHHLHESFTVQAAQAGRHILVEKPMALDEAEARRMVAAADDAGVLLAVGQSTRCMPALRQAHALLADGAIGSVHHLLHQRVFHIERLSTDWRRATGECGGLYLPLFGSHDVDAALWLLGAAGTPAVPDRVWASLRARSAASDGDSDGVLCLDLSGGGLATFQFSVCSRQKRTEWLLVGETGTLAVEQNRVLRDGEVLQAPKLEGSEYGHAFAEQVRQMAAAVRGTGPLPAPGAEVLTVVRTLDLARAAAADGVARTY